MVLLRLSVICVFIVASTACSFSQVTDSTGTDSASVPLTKEQKKAMYYGHHSPRRAALMSTCFPGLGQIYNKKYWKAAIVYAGFGGLIYAFEFYQPLYVQYRNAYENSIDTSKAVNPVYSGYSSGDLLSLQEYYHHYRDLTIIGMGLLYVLNIVDATVDAHLFEFDVSNNLSMNFRPKLIYSAATNSYQTQLALNFNFK